MEDIEYNYCFESLYMCSENRHMKKAGNEKLEMVIGNENESKKTSISIVQCFLHGLMSNVLCHYSCIPIALYCAL